MKHRIAHRPLHHARSPAAAAGAIILLAALAASCAGLPRLQTVSDSLPPDGISDCRDLFPDGSWRFVHAIEPVISGHRAGVLLGITVVAPAKREVEAVIMTLEGMVLFHGRGSEGGIDIRRALAPFDSPHFAKGVLADVTLLFLPPEAAQTQVGMSPGEAFTCRYIRSDGSVVDVLPNRDGGWQLLEYGRRANLRRRVSADPDGGCSATVDTGLPCRIELNADQRPAYTLRMSLIEAERIGKEDR